MSRRSKNGQLPIHNDETLPPQEIIDLFKIIFNDELYKSDETFEKLLADVQIVKSDLYNRDYINAFNNDIKRIAYCCRWSPSRATSYSSLFAHLDEVVHVIKCKDMEDQSVLCIGGGAGSEFIAIASMFTTSRELTSKYATKNKDKDEDDENEQDDADASRKTTLNLQLVDIANWDTIIKRINDTISDKWLYNNEHEYFNVKFTENDILKMSSKELNLPSLNLITLLFTTNELFSEHKAESIRFLQKLNSDCQSGCLLLIVESAGSFSHITIGTKKFPIQFLIDTVLVGKRGEERHGSWEIIAQNDSIWYRGDTSLDYPIKLENMRFFYRLYRKK
ncbi:25S rRNA (uracil2843-N3)-methyltransferase NDAI_0C06480 [Naumovozyma dairenensis CBS 421]|uniref:25S rRNA (Uridine(2843)-N(3))-methyltransferase n=1 Tax=Naumovozyma dairenensis (strain ATCC 10597 / BCRC 20456 / CBS 421 / NBRC 0211 / NRRL Y-12639) TaxID=1071378 RepID=G0W946_NAUDC|nr:hypothetical protein NDAI_0C06480 [Naumovozyma dairenensis CBS 421]CCD24307.1 hypothetical protein NDAI_0C06480 [Naumovozyma dairenensis CBS 421]